MNLTLHMLEVLRHALSVQCFRCVEWGIAPYVDVSLDTEDKTMSQMVNPLYDDPCCLLTYSSSLCLINQSQHKYTCTHTRTLADTHVHLPVWIISGFPQWGIECVVCVVCSPLSLTFPSELPNTVGLITHSPNAYLSARWQLI